MVKEKVLDLANKISMTKRGAKNEITPNDPEYKILEPIVTEEMAEVALYLEFRKPQSAEEISKKCGKSLEETERLLWELAKVGAAFVNKIDGVDKFWHEVWVPGHMEMIVNNRENAKKYPQLGRAFDEYGKKKGPIAAGNVPIGLGPMRVIPIEKAIQGETRRASFEEISKYLNENTIFSVSDCSCRTAREAMGEGCGHLKEDMCIQLGHAAEYYIRTGRGRQITREEAFEIIKRAEENGLMHCIPNTDGPGKTHAICNCCGCGCFAVRIANMFVNPDMVRSNYVAQVDKDKCVACGECVENCPTNALKLGQKLCSKKPIVEEKRELPYDTEWGPDKWNPDYRINRKVVLETGSSPCKAECPAHIGIQGYIKLAAQGRYTEALELIKQENPFPAVCGRICPRYCESECTRGDIDDPIAIDEIKKFIAEQDLNQERRYIPKKRHNYGKKIAVIGSGPAGLSCAYYLAIDGYKVTVFEKEKVLGGMLTLGIPSFRLEKDVVNAEIDVLKELGVEFKTGIEVGKDVTINDLRAQGFEAFYIAIGAQSGRKLGIEGENSEGIITGVEFLRKVNLGELKSLNGNVVVVGGGNVAMDVARTAVRLGATKVDIYCLEKKEEMPALDEEIEEAVSEGVNINNSWGPKRILVENGHVVGVEFKRCVSVYDENGKFNPKYDENEIVTVNADFVLVSVGQAIDWGGLLKGTNIEINKNNTVKVDPDTYQTTEKDVFAGGDIVTGPKFAIDAIAMGKEGAISIHRFVHPGQSLILGRTKRNYKAFDKENVILKGYDRTPRQRPIHVDGSKAKETFRDLRGTFTEEQVKKETERCLSCGVTVVDEFMCIGCGQCVTKCRFDAIKLVKKYNAQNPEFNKMKPTIMKYALKRKIRITLKKPFKYMKSFFIKK
ncbi:FAD-dependent oxidoreductase [Thermobrachium celere]|uniref:Formate dehydrogenase-O, major subunit n=1 Tax=Thermobrachium celere DSM 8682 TaxID=941824 RepID=R7RT88_9CLOT|nr:FAD-dependent oxidoreductase [Thermobrachium celere]CDF58596.1 Formate dehydrogenase-O, major subunit [Thermobrachium celere DSM 8682]